MKKFAVILIAALAASPAMAQQSAGEALSDGEVRKVDKEAKKITIRHGPLANLDMPAMTMVFQVKDPAMLEKVKAGDKVKFEAEKVGGAFTVTKIEPAK
jgi:Cu(I)/Ag(I) efflux system periplasmic protein CusF